MVRSYFIVAVLVVLFVSSIVHGRSIDESSGLDETVVHHDLIAEDEITNENIDDEHQRVRRSWCDESRCQSSAGKCVNWGHYECIGSSIRQCIANNEWRTIGNCPSTCRYFGRGINRHPYCI